MTLMNWLFIARHHQTSCNFLSNEHHAPRLPSQRCKLLVRCTSVVKPGLMRKHHTPSQFTAMIWCMTRFMSGFSLSFHQKSSGRWLHIPPENHAMESGGMRSACSMMAGRIALSNLAPTQFACLSPRVVSRLRARKVVPTNHRSFSSSHGLQLVETPSSPDSAN